MFVLSQVLSVNVAKLAVDIDYVLITRRFVFYLSWALSVKLLLQNFAALCSVSPCNNDTQLLK